MYTHRLPPRVLYKPVIDHLVKTILSPTNRDMNMMADKLEGIDCLNDDIIQNILARLPALSFAAAACVSKTWDRVCSQILSRPKLASALSLNPSLIVSARPIITHIRIIQHFSYICP